MALRSDFARRLMRVSRSIDKSLFNDSISSDLLPSLFSLFTYMWCKTNKKYSLSSDTLDY